MGFRTVWFLIVIYLTFALAGVTATRDSKSEMGAVLRQLYSTVGTKDPTLRWGPNTDFCEWDGIKCDTQGLISELSLDYAHKLIDNDELLDVRLDTLHTLRVLRLKGFNNLITFTGLFNLTELRELNFEKSSFQIDIQTSAWLRLTSLETLDLRGTYTESQFLGGWIYCHPSLKTLRVKIYFFSDTSSCNNTVLEKASVVFFANSGTEICNYFSNLRELEIQTTSLTCITPRVEKLSAYLTISNELPQLPNQLRELRVKSAKSNPNLQTLLIPNTLEILESNSWQLPQLTISKNTALKELRLNNIGYKSWADIDYLFDAVKSHLEVIDVSNNQLYKLLDLTKFPQLKHFNISGNQIVDQIPSDLPSKLTLLDLSENKLYGDIPTTICQAAALEHLILFSNGLTGSIPNCLGEALHNLRSVMLHKNSLTGPIPQSLILNPNLQILALAFNGLSGTLPDNLEAAKELIQVQLTWNGLQGRVPSVLPKKLSILDLSYNEFTGQLNGSTFKNLSLVSLFLNNNQLEGSIPEELFTMPQLEQLELSANKFSGPIPRTISDNVLLTHLAFSKNKLNGSIPFITCPCKELLLDNNEFSGSLFNTFSTTFLNAIEVLDVDGNQLEDYFSWNSLPELRFLRFSNNRILHFFITAPKLLELYASNNIITNFEITTPELQVLEIANNRLSSAIANSFSSLVRLDMSGNRLASPMIIDSTMAPVLRYCNFSHNQLTDVRFATNLVSWPIETIDLSHNKLRIEFPFKLHARSSPSLRHLRHLRNLHLNDNQIYGRVSEMDTILIAKLHVLNLANNQMYGALDAGLFDIVDKSESKLNVLNLSGNRDIILKKENLRDLMSLPALTQLSLSHCSIGGFSEDFPLLNRLEVLELAGCTLSGKIPTEAIRKLRLLRRIDLSSNDFTEMPKPEAWELLIGLEHLDLSGNPHLEGVLPAELSQSGLRYIDVSNTKLSGSLPLIRSNVINVARFANCSFTGFVDQLSIKDQMAEFDISNNRLRTFHSGWNALNCLNDSTNSNTSRQPFAKKCNMRGNDFQCYAFPDWTIDCCGAVCSHTEELAYAISGSLLTLTLLIIAVAMTLYYGRRYLSKRKNEKSLEHLERSLLAHAFDSVEHDMMIAWSDINFIAKIGEGAFGIVYKGLYKGTEVAVKALKVAPTASLTTSSSESNATEEYRVTLNELITEVRFLMKLKHPNIVLLMGASIDKGRMAIVLEYMHHGSLHDLLHKSKTKNMDWKTKCRIAHQIACGMQYLHLQTPPVIHRDLKSMNILIDKNMTAKITDFGFSRENGATSMTSMVGTISYMAPEMFGQTDDLSSTSTTSTSSTTAVYDTACDVYSFGILLWELLTEQIPWHNCSQPMLIVSVLNGSRPPIPELDTYTMVHYTRISTSPATDYQSAETMDSDSTSLLDFSTTADSTTSTMQSALSDDIKRYIEVMKQCWAQNPRERPSFSTIAKTLEALLVK